jgi:hypothetical protein
MRFECYEVTRLISSRTPQQEVRSEHMQKLGNNRAHEIHVLKVDEGQ